MNMLMRAAVHDIDKMIMYLFLDQKEAQEMLKDRLK